MQTKFLLRSSAAALFAAVLVFASASDAVAVTYYTTNINSVVVTYSVVDNKAVIGTGTQAAAIDTATAGTLSLPSTLGGYTLASIADYGFNNCTNLRNVYLSSSITSVGGFAFTGCTNLSRVVIPSGVTILGDYAFLRCLSLTAIQLPASLTALGTGVFGSCGALTNIAVAADNAAFASTNGLLCTKDKTTLLVCPCGKTGALEVPPGTRNIGDSAFFQCGGLTALTIPSGVTNIAGSAFYGCGGLAEVALPDTVAVLGEWALACCSNLTAVTLGAGLGRIGTSAFYSCGKLSGLTVPGTVTNIGSGAFRYCGALTNIYYLGNAPTVGTSIYQNTPAALTNHVGRGSTGWDGTANGGTLPATWQGRAIVAMSPAVYCRKAWNMDGFTTTGMPDVVTFTMNVATIAGAALGDNHTAGLALTTGNGRLAFRWNVSSEEGADFARCMRDGTLVAERSGKNGGWEWVTNTVASGGPHIWTFIYAKDGSDGAGTDTAWFADFSWEPYRAVAVTHGSGGGLYFAGETVTVTAAPPLRDAEFVEWTGDTELLEDVTSSTVTFTMPATNVTLTAAYTVPYESLVMLDQIEAAYHLPTGSVNLLEVPAAVGFVTNVVGVDGAVLGDGLRSGMTLSTIGDGKLVFRWNVSSELSDMAGFMLDGSILMARSGKTCEWQWVTNTVTDNAAHLWTFFYKKDANSKAGQDTAWFADIAWHPFTHYSPMAVPYSWLDGYELPGGNFAADYEAAATNVFANGVPAWQSYVAGLVPTNPASRFLALISMANGRAVVTWTPDDSSQRVYTVEGRTNLTDSGWISPTNSAHRFFRVKVELK